MKPSFTRNFACRFAAVLACAIVFPSADSLADTFPARPIKIITNGAPGSSLDLIARSINERMTEDLGQPVIVENRPGAGGTIASEAAARAPADGYTLFLGGVDAIVYAFVLQDRPPLDPLTDFAPIGRVWRDHWVLAVSGARRKLRERPDRAR
jgi:tripartite-type tricarboxylate transporter receptor subunit TctC